MHKLMKKTISKYISNTIVVILVTVGAFSIVSAQNLSQLQRMAAENNPALRAKYKEFEAALQRSAQISSLPDPTFSFGYFISPVETRVGPQRAMLSLSQMFPWFGTLSAHSEANALMAEAKYQSFLEMKNKVFWQVATAYFPLYEWQENMRVEKDNIALLESLKSIATTKFENAEGSLVDVLRVDLKLKEAKNRLLNLTEKESALLSLLAKNIGTEDLALISINDTLELEVVASLSDKSQLVETQPMLSSFDANIAASKATQYSIKKQGLPKFGLGLNYTVVDKMSIANPIDNGKDVILPTLSVSIPLYRSKYTSAYRESELMAESYELLKADYVLSLQNDYKQSLFELEQQKNNSLLYKAQIEEAQQILNLLYSEYSNSGKEFEDILDIQQQILQYKNFLAKSLSMYHIALAKMDYVLAKN